MGKPPHWLSESVIYQIYPQSFADGNGDGIGDLAGIRRRLDYLQWLGVTAIWLNPCFESPFADGGYDVSDYRRVAPRYGDNAELIALFEAAHQRGIRVLLDLVAGHTSDQHPWFIESARGADTTTADRYIWTPDAAIRPPGFEPSPGERNGCYLPNFFAGQPALNFGYARQHPDEPWRQSPHAPGPMANREELRQIMAYWLDRGADGFRVDMAASLIKADDDGRQTRALWRQMRHWLERRYPQAVLLSEWGRPAEAVAAGFHLDFFLQHVGRAFRSLFDNGAAVSVPDWPPGECYFDSAGDGSPVEFLDEWKEVSEQIGDAGLVGLPTANHDFARLVCGDRDSDQARPAMVFQFCWPAVPTLFQGEEIGMRYLPGLPDKEGSVLGETYNRAGSRTPVQWSAGEGAGFSTAPPSRWYLPIDPDPSRPTVAAQRVEPDSLLHLVRRLIALRRAHPALGPAGSMSVLSRRRNPYPLVFLRTEGARAFLIAVNPRARAAEATLELTGDFEPVMTAAAKLSGDTVALDGHGYGIWTARV